MAKFAIYPRGNNSGVKHFQIKRTPKRFLSVPNGLHLSFAEYTRLMNLSADIEVLPSGIRVGEERPLTSKINLRIYRNNTSNCVDAVFISPFQLKEMAGYFKVPEQTLNQALFDLKPGSAPADPLFYVKPVWSELLTPEWRNAYLRWLEGKGRIPRPSEINWQSSGRGRLAMPGLATLFYFSEAKDTIIKGTLALEEIGGLKTAAFSYKTGRDRKNLFFKLGLEGAEYLNHNRPEIDANAGIPPWNRGTFKKMFGKSPSVREYLFLKKARKTGMALGNVGGFQFFINSSARNFSFVEGETYVLACIRQDNTLVVEVRSKSDPGLAVARGAMQLDTAVFLPQRPTMLLGEV